jgi:hypothetical protein
MLIEITKCVDRRHRKAGPGGRGGRRTDRHARNEHFFKAQG